MNKEKRKRERERQTNQRTLTTENKTDDYQRGGGWGDG